MTNPVVADLLARSNRLGADPRNMNDAGGNISAKGQDLYPVTDERVDLMWIKVSGGDLGTLTEGDLATLRLDRLRALVGVYPGVEREHELVAAFDFWLDGKGVPSAGCPRDPMSAFATSRYQAEIESTRLGGTQAGWGP